MRRYFATRYGALDGLTFCASGRPGRLYEIVVDREVRKLQHWARQYLPRLRSWHVRTSSRLFWSGALADGIAQYVEGCRQNRICSAIIRRLNRKLEVGILNTWRHYIERLHVYRTLLKAANRRVLVERMARILEFSQDQRDIRKQKLVLAMEKFQRNLEVRCLNTWRVKAVQCKQLKEMNKRIMAKLKPIAFAKFKVQVQVSIRNGDVEDASTTITRAAARHLQRTGFTPELKVRRLVS